MKIIGETYSAGMRCGQDDASGQGQKDLTENTGDVFFGMHFE